MPPSYWFKLYKAIPSDWIRTCGTMILVMTMEKPGVLLPSKQAINAAGK